MYLRSSDFAVNQPEQLRRDLQQMDRRIEEAFAALSRTPAYKIVSVYAEYTAAIGELVLVDTTAADVDVFLPEATVQNSGLRIAVAVFDGDNSIRLSCPKSVLNGISGAAATVSHSETSVRSLFSLRNQWWVEY